ncbi:MAG: SusC/RagA family TonB-linked outer membrane protein [Chitinophagaceae bacterium]
MKNVTIKRPWKMYCALLVGLFLAGFVGAQVTIKGKVTDDKGNGIPGASVAVKGSNEGTATEVDGTFSLRMNLPKKDYILAVSSVGFASAEKKFTVSGVEATVNISLFADAAGLDEVIVTGTSAGTTKKQLGSFVTTLKADQLNKGIPSAALQSLQGKVAGAQISQNSGDPSGGMSVRLRGISSINGSSEPLYIVDGVIVNNATNRVTNTQSGYDGGGFVGTIGQSRMSDINPADIDHVEVLNGAAAAAIYGSRANAGVVQIFTKRGANSAPVVSFSTNYMMSSLRKQVPHNMAPTKFGGPTDGPTAQTQDILSPALTNTTAVTRYNYWDYIFRDASGTDNNLSIRGGNDKTKYFASASYFYNEGIIKNTDYNRFSFRVNLDQTINKWASMSAGLNYINSAANEKPDGNSFFSPMNSITILGNFHNFWQRDALGNLQAVGERGRINPVSVLEDFKQRNETNRVLGNMSLKLKPFKGFTLDYTMGIDNYSQNGTTYLPPYTYNASPAFWGGGATLDPTQNGYASAASNNFFQINHEVNATYQINIIDDLASTTQVGYSAQYEKNKYILTQGRGLAPLVETVNGASTAIPGVDSRSEISVSGYYLQQNFKWRNHIFITGAVRVDGSSVFGEDERNQVYTKASGSYVFSSTDYWKNLGVSKWWDLAKVRVAYGESGNLTGIGAYDRFNSYSTNSYLSRTALFSSTGLANTKVKPERQQETEFGADLGFLRNRVNVTFNYYIKKVSDLLINRQVAPTTGFSTLLDNFGSLENKGFELVVNATPFKKKDFSWDVTGIFSHNRNKATKIGQALTLLSTNAGAPVAIIEGQPIGIFYGTFFAVDASGNQIKSATGIPQLEKGIQNSVLGYTTQRDPLTGLPLGTGTTLRKIIGDPNPDYTTSLINTFNYKGLSLRVQLDAVKGGEVFNADFRTRQGVGNGEIAEQEDKGLVPRGYISGIYAVEQWRISDGSYTKLRELSVSYDFGKIGPFSSLTASAAGRNLISWDNYNGFDPEVNAAGQSTILRNIDFGAVPIPRTFSIGVSAKF